MNHKVSPLTSKVEGVQQADCEKELKGETFRWDWVTSIQYSLESQEAKCVGTLRSGHPKWDLELSEKCKVPYKSEK